MEDKDREIWVGKNKIYLGGDNIVRVTPVGEVDEENAIAIFDAVLKFLNMVEGKVKVILDLNKSGKISTKAKKMALKMVDNEKIGKLAFFGLHPVARVLASFFMGVSQKKDMRFFKKEEEALAWFKD